MKEKMLKIMKSNQADNVCYLLVLTIAVLFSLCIYCEANDFVIFFLIIAAIVLSIFAILCSCVKKHRDEFLENSTLAQICFTDKEFLIMLFLIITAVYFVLIVTLMPKYNLFYIMVSILISSIISIIIIKLLTNPFSKKEELLEEKIVTLKVKKHKNKSNKNNKKLLILLKKLNSYIVMFSFIVLIALFIIINWSYISENAYKSSDLAFGLYFGGYILISFPSKLVQALQAFEDNVIKNNKVIYIIFAHQPLLRDMMCISVAIAIYLVVRIFHTINFGNLIDIVAIFVVFILDLLLSEFISVYLSDSYNDKVKK